jgi:flagellar basal body-associated protein FliL
LWDWFCGMKIQVCRKCGNRNTVISSVLSGCNYCGSDDLEPVIDTDASATEGAASGSSGKLKWIILLLLLLLALAAAWFILPFLSDDKTSKSESASVPNATNLNESSVANSQELKPKAADSEQQKNAITATELDKAELVTDENMKAQQAKQDALVSEKLDLNVQPEKAAKSSIVDEKEKTVNQVDNVKTETESKIVALKETQQEAIHVVKKPEVIEKPIVVKPVKK